MRKENEKMKFSVLLSVYVKEKPKYLKEALESIRYQTIQPAEIVLIEDGLLTKELYSVLAEYEKKFPYMKRYSFDKNQGLGIALAKGVELCSNELIARMDTDDLAVRNRFEKQVEYMEKHPEIAVCGGLIEEFSDQGDVHRIKGMPEKMEDIEEYVKYRNPLNHMTVMFRKAAVLAVGNYQRVPYLEDYDLWSRMIVNGARFYNIQQVLVKARVSDQLYNKRGGLEYCKEYLKLRGRQKKLGILNNIAYIKSCVQTILITIVPIAWRKKIYVTLLRNTKQYGND